MTEVPVLTGQDIAEAQGALTRLLDRGLAGTGVNRHEYVILRVLTVRGPFPSPKELHEFLVAQQQLGLTPEGVADILAAMAERGLATGTGFDDPGPAAATPEGATLLATLTRTVAPATRQLFAGFDPDDLATTHRVLTRVTERAGQIQ